jgi:hypothetical protein
MLVTDVLEYKGDLRKVNLCPQQIIVVVLQLGIREMIPPANHCHPRNRFSKHDTYVLASPYNNTGALMACFPPLHLLHLNVSCVSHNVFSLNKNNCRNASIEKCRSAFSFSSTTADDRACFDAWRWNIFSSMVPVEMNL